MEKDDKGITVKKADNFSEWYIQAVLKADLVDYGPVQGSTAFKPNSYSIWESIQDVFNGMIKKTGHKNAYFPLLIPESFLTKEADHFSGFVPEVFWVTQSGNNKLGERLAVRPTSETIIYHFFSRWIKSWRDLPMLLNQWCNVLRAEIKATKPFTRTSEFLWQEGHTAHETEAEANKEVTQILGFYRQIAEDYLALPVVSGLKSEGEKFAGAAYTTTLEAMMPDGKALQVATSHSLGQNFSKPFGITFLDHNNTPQNAWTTSWGMSTRMIGAMAMVHGDDKGVIMPPKVAYSQAVIVPIFNDATKNNVLVFTGAIKEALEKGGIRTYVDDRDVYTPGYKFNEWELRGIPLRIEIGQREVDANSVVLVRRDTGTKSTVKSDDALTETGKALDEIQSNLFNRAKAVLDSLTSEALSYSDMKTIIKSKGGFVKMAWCGRLECENRIKEETGATVRAIPFGQTKPSGSCPQCGAATTCSAIFARSY